MVKLIAKSAFDHPATTIGGVTLTPTAVEPTTSIAPLRGQGPEVANRLRAATGLDWPAPGLHVTNGTARLLWAGRAHALLIGPGAPGLDGLAATTDQTGAEAVLEVSGPDTLPMLARLVPLDLRPSVFAPNTTARTQIAHMTGSVTCLALDHFELRVMRSMAGTLWHDVTRAATLLAARQ